MNVRQRGPLRQVASPQRQAKVVIYARVSSKEQEEEGYSVPAQLRLLRDYAARKGLEIAEEFIEAETAKRAGRMAFDQMLKFVRDNGIKVLLVEKTDRLYRNFSDFVKVDELGVDLHFVKEGQVITTDSHSSEKLMHSIKVCLAKNYVDNLSEEIRKGMDEKASQGIYPSHAPLGYFNVADGSRKKIVPDTVRAPLVRRVFEAYALGQISINNATTFAAEIGLKTKKGKRVQKSSIAIMLCNEAYIGKFRWKGVLREGKHDPIVDADTFYRVQEIMTGRTSRKGFGRVPISYRGLIRCTKCGNLLSGEIKKGKYVYYHCARRQSGCDSPYVKEEWLTEQFSKVFATLTIPADIVVQLKDAMIESSRHEQQFAKGQRGHLEREAEKLRARLASLYEDKLAGEVSGDTYKLLRERYESEIADAERLLRNLNHTGTTWREKIQRYLELCVQAEDRFKQGDADYRRELLGFLCSNSEFDGQALKISISPEFKKLFECLTDAKTKASETGQSVDWWR